VSHLYYHTLQPCRQRVTHYLLDHPELTGDIVYEGMHEGFHNWHMKAALV